MNSGNKDKRNFILMLVFLGLVLISSILIFDWVTNKESKLEQTQPETFETPEQAYLKTKEVLFDVSEKINKGVYSIEKVKTIEQLKN